MGQSLLHTSHWPCIPFQFLHPVFCSLLQQNSLKELWDVLSLLFFPPIPFSKPTPIALLIPQYTEIVLVEFFHDRPSAPSSGDFTILSLLSAAFLTDNPLPSSWDSSSFGFRDTTLSVSYCLTVCFLISSAGFSSSSWLLNISSRFRLFYSSNHPLGVPSSTKT